MARGRREILAAVAVTGALASAGRDRALTTRRRLPPALGGASYRAWTSESTSLTDAFASPNSIEVFGS
jgi:hypothetical protein